MATFAHRVATLLACVAALLALVMILSYIAPPAVDLPSSILDRHAIDAKSAGGICRFPGEESRLTCFQECSQDIVANRRTTVTHPITLVTGYYRIPSKHPVDDYVSRMGNFLVRIRTPTVVFTNNQTFRDVEAFRALLLSRARLMPGRTHTTFLELEATPLAKEFGPVMKRQEGRDPERFRGHNYLLYLVWLLKSEAILAAVAENLFCSDWFMWVDAGCFRDEKHKFQFWPSVRSMNALPKDRVFMELINPFIRDSNDDWLASPRNTSEWLRQGEIDCIDGDHIAGTYIAVNIRRGTPQRFYQTLISTLRKLVTVDHLIIKDQTAFNAMYMLSPSLFAFLPCRDDAGQSEWVYMEAWLAEVSERPKDVGLSSILIP